MTGWAVLACVGTPAKVELSKPPSATARAEAGRWIVGERIPELDCKTDGATYAWMALESPPVAAAVAVDALATCAGEPDRALVAQSLLTSTDPGVAGAALRLASSLFAEGVENNVEAELVAGVVTCLSHSDPAVRYEAVEVLDSRVWTADPSLEAHMLGRLGDSSPPVVSELLYRAYDRAAGLQDPGPWAATARYAMRAHLDPGIRGRSARLLARLDPGSATTSQVLKAALTDPHPYVRASAATGLEEVGDPAAIPELMALVNDPEGTVWTMLPWTGTDGRKREQVHRGSHFERVDDAVLRALVELSLDEETPYEMRPVSLRYLDLDLVGSARDAARWYEERGANAEPVADEPASD